MCQWWVYCFGKCARATELVLNFLIFIAVISSSINVIRSVSIFNVSCGFVLPRHSDIASDMVLTKLPDIDPLGSIACTTL